MPFRNTAANYGYIAQTLHWVMALSFIAMFIIAEVMMHMTTDPTNTFFGSGKWALYGLHKSVGMVLLLLIILRILWKVSNPKPPLNGQGVQKLLAAITHYGLYAVMLIMPLSGYVMSSAGGYGVKVFGLKLPDLLGENKPLGSLAHSVHHYASEAVYILVALHLIGALFHHYVVKDDTFLRMFWRNK